MTRAPGPLVVLLSLALTACSSGNAAPGPHGNEALATLARLNVVLHDDAAPTATGTKHTAAEYASDASLGSAKRTHVRQVVAIDRDLRDCYQGVRADDPSTDGVELHLTIRDGRVAQVVAIGGVGDASRCLEAKASTWDVFAGTSSATVSLTRHIGELEGGNDGDFLALRRLRLIGAGRGSLPLTSGEAQKVAIDLLGRFVSDTPWQTLDAGAAAARCLPEKDVAEVAGALKRTLVERGLITALSRTDDAVQVVAVLEPYYVVITLEPTVTASTITKAPAGGVCGDTLHYPLVETLSVDKMGDLAE